MTQTRFHGFAAAAETCKENSKRRIIVAKNGEIQNVAIVGTGVIGRKLGRLLPVPHSM